jgi:hypothetical protein
MLMMQMFDLSLTESALKQGMQSLFLVVEIRPSLEVQRAKFATVLANQSLPPYLQRA